MWRWSELRINGRRLEQGGDGFPRVSPLRLGAGQIILEHVVFWAGGDSLSVDGEGFFLSLELKQKQAQVVVCLDKVRLCLQGLSIIGDGFLVGGLIIVRCLCLMLTTS